MNEFLSTRDLVVFGLYFVVIVIYGLYIYYRKKSAQVDSKEYFLAEGSLTWWAIGASLIDLPITYSAIATNLQQEKEVVFRHGSVYQAIRASIAIPAIFRAVVTENDYLVDGGLLNPVPVNHVQNTDNIVIAVNLDGPPVEGKGKALNQMNALDLLQESYVVMRRRLCNLTVALHKPDYIIDVPHNLCGIWEFDRSADLLLKGTSLADEYFGNRDLVKQVF